MLLGDKVDRIMEMASDLGFRLSLITNGSMLPDGMESLASKLSVLGVSIDSININTSRRIGRFDRRGTLSLDELSEKLHLARRVNPHLQIKINTVVNALNVQENLGEVIGRVRPDRWKLLRVLPVLDTSLAITDKEFLGFLRRHQAFSDVMAPEDNQLMTESYIMVDPLGRFFQNTSQVNSRKPYAYSSPILSVGAEHAFASVRFSPAKFAARYIPVANAVSAK